MQAEALQREQESRDEVERGVKADAKQGEQEAREREGKLLHELMSMKEQLTQLLKLVNSSHHATLVEEVFLNFCLLFFRFLSLTIIKFFCLE